MKNDIETGFINLYRTGDDQRILAAYFETREEADAQDLTSKKDYLRIECISMEAIRMLKTITLEAMEATQTGSLDSLHKMISDYMIKGIEEDKKRNPTLWSGPKQ